MSERKFKFVSPGVFLNEIDNSQMPKTAVGIGPVVIGRSERGPALKPVRVESYSEFIDIFGNPIAGGSGDDVWRQGSEHLAPSYGIYAVQAYLRNSAPITFVRLLGAQDDDAVSGGEAGWIAKNGSTTGADNAWGVFVGMSGSARQGYTRVAASSLGLISVGTQAQNDAFEVTVPAAAGGTGIIYTVVSRNGNNLANPPANTLYWNGSGATATRRDNLIKGLVGAVTNDAAIAVSGSGFQGKGIKGLAAGDGYIADGPQVVDIGLAASQGGTAGNGITIKQTVGTVQIPSLALNASMFLSGGIDYNTACQPKLGAVLVLNNASSIVDSEINLVGTNVGGETIAVATGEAKVEKHVIRSNTSILTDANWTLVVENDRFDFSFNRSSDNFIRKALNTNPVLTNSVLTNASSLKKFWLAETFETEIQDNLMGNSDLASGFTPYAFLAPLTYHGTRQEPVKTAATGWFFSQNTGPYGSWAPENMQRLFKFHAVNEGEDAARNFKISIVDIRPPTKDGVNPYGSFSVMIRKASDSDNTPQVIERFSNCNLNPNSSDYVARKIGDVFQEWNDTEKRYKFYGNYNNMSKYIRVEMNSEVDSGLLEDPSLVPFGVFGPPVYRSFTVDFLAASGSGTGFLNGTSEVTWASLTASDGVGNSTLMAKPASAQPWGFTASCPALRLRHSASDGGMIDKTRAFFGLQSTRSKSSTRHDFGYGDYLSRLGSAISAENDAIGTSTQYSWIFSLDDVVVAGSREGQVFYESGSCVSGRSYSALNVDGSRDLLDKVGINKFTAPLFGGHDGVNLTYSNPFCNALLDNKTTTNSSAYASVKRALDSVADPEVVECNLMAMPGVTEETLTTMMVRNCEARADALAVVDLPDVYIPPEEKKILSSATERLGSGVDAVAETFGARGINSSYGCTYYPWLRVYDEINDQQVWTPPSVIALGVFANTERKRAVWFAPAGFNRGGLSEGSAGLPVLGVTERLNVKERDKLYENNINPIATFPSEGIVVFGQKTLQTTRSALDRINVRRMLIYVKKKISRISSRILFDQNVQETWDRFLGQVTPFLEGVKQGFGLSEFKVVLDSSTTTPDLVDRNIMYAKIFLKPARSIEFIAIDFVITRSGASFED